MSKKDTTRVQEIKQPRKVNVSTYLQSMALTALIVGAIGLVAGYFIAINVHGQARAAVVADMQVVEQTAKKAQ